MGDKFWKARDRRILWKWFGTKRIPSTGQKAPDGMTDHEVLEIFQWKPPRKLEQEFAQAEREAGNDKIPWIIFGAKGSRDEDKWIATKLSYFPKIEQQGEAGQEQWGQRHAPDDPRPYGQTASPCPPKNMPGGK